MKTPELCDFLRFDGMVPLVYGLMGLQIRFSVRRGKAQAKINSGMSFCLCI